MKLTFVFSMLIFQTLSSQVLEVEYIVKRYDNISSLMDFDEKKSVPLDFSSNDFEPIKEFLYYNKNKYCKLLLNNNDDTLRKEVYDLESESKYKFYPYYFTEKGQKRDTLFITQLPFNTTQIGGAVIIDKVNSKIDKKLEINSKKKKKILGKKCRKKTIQVRSKVDERYNWDFVVWHTSLGLPKIERLRFSPFDLSVILPNGDLCLSKKVFIIQKKLIIFTKAISLDYSTSLDGFNNLVYIPADKIYNPKTEMDKEKYKKVMLGIYKNGKNLE